MSSPWNQTEPIYNVPALAVLFGVDSLVVEGWLRCGLLAPAGTSGRSSVYFHEALKLASTHPELVRDPDEGTNVLLVDDDPLLLRLYRRIFDDRFPELTLRMTPCSFDAQLLACVHFPSLVFLDRHLPGLNGEQLCARLRALPGLQTVPIVGFSADSCPAALSEMLRSGATEIVERPMSIDVFVELVRRHLGFDPV